VDDANLHRRGSRLDRSFSDELLDEIAEPDARDERASFRDPERIAAIRAERLRP